MMNSGKELNGAIAAADCKKGRGGGQEGSVRARKISIGAQSFESIRTRECFFVDKTGLIKEWWENEDVVTLITRPRRFGKTLNLDMLNCFFRSSMRAGESCSRACPSGRRRNTVSFRGAAR